MDLRSCLKDGDLFVSYWFADQLMAVVGDSDGLRALDSIPADALDELVWTFEAHVSQLPYYAGFVNQRFRPDDWPQPLVAPVPLREIFARLAPRLIPAELRRRAQSGAYRRLILFPDGILHALPLHLLLEAALDAPVGEAFPGGVLYAPSASVYAYCCAKQRRGSWRQATVLLGHDNDAQFSEEAQRIANLLPFPAQVVSQFEEAERVASQADIVYVVSHGWSAQLPQTGARSPDESEWGFAFDHGRLGPEDFFRGRLRLQRGAVVVLSACSVGHLLPGPCHELQGLVRALFYAGAATVLAARWPVLDETAGAVFCGTLQRAVDRGCSLAQALSASLAAAARLPDLQRIMAGPDAATFFWGPFALFGCGD